MPLSKQIDAQSFEIIEVPIEWLRPHPLQAELFGDISKIELDALAADMLAHGQRDPVHILPNYQLVFGHQRRRAGQQLQWPTLRAVVRHDLVGKEDKITELLVSENLIRRQLDQFALARCYVALRGTMNSNRNIGETGKINSLRKSIVARYASIGLPIADRTLSRYVALLKLPRPILDAIVGKRLSQRDGGSLLDRCARDQKLVADACAAGQNKMELAQLMRQIKGASKSFANRRFSESVNVLATLGRSSDQLDEIANRYLNDARIAERLEAAKATLSGILTSIYSKLPSGTGKDKMSRRSRTLRGN